MMNSFAQPTFAPTRGTAWALVILGILAIVAGIVAIVFPGLTLLTLVAIFGWFAIVTGVLEIIHAFTSNRTTEGRIILGLWGVVTVILGLIALFLPGITLRVFVLWIAAYFFVTGVIQIIAALRGHLHGWLLLWGVLGIIAGVVALVWPGLAALTLAIIFGVYAIIGGLSSLFAGIAVLRGRSRTASMPTAERRAS